MIENRPNLKRILAQIEDMESKSMASMAVWLQTKTQGYK